MVRESPASVCLGEVAHVEMGQSPPSVFVTDEPDTGLPFLQGNAEFTESHPQPRLWCKKPQKSCQANDVLISVRAPVGAINVADRSYCIGRGLAAVRFSKANARFGLHALRYFSTSLKRVAQGTTFEAIGRSDLTDLRLLLPSPPEQRSIGLVLDTLEEVIGASEQIITKLRATRQGLLVGLLTRGIDENGVPRDPGRQPDQFKASTIGVIPRDWQACAVEELLADVNPAMRSGPFGSALLKSELVESGVPVVGIDNVHVERFVDEYTRFVRRRKAAELSRYRVRPRDVMITIMGTVGRSCLVPLDVGEILSSKHVWTLTFDQPRYSPFLASLQFNYAPWVLSHFNRDVQGGIMSAIRAETLKTTVLPVPPRQEMDRIEAILATASARLADEIALRNRLRLLQEGLSQDLLSGRVDVRNLLQEGAA